MWSSQVEYKRPTTIDTCLRLLSRSDPYTIPLAGGTWVMTKNDPKVKAVVDLSALNLSFIKHSVRRIRLGAMTTLLALIESPVIQNLANGLLRDASCNDAPDSIRNIATIGGTIAVGDSLSEVCLALMALDAKIVLHADIVRSISLKDFYKVQVESLPHASIITEINIPQPTTRIGCATSKEGSTSSSRPTVIATVQVSRVGNTCRMARIALGGVADHPIRLPEIESMTAYQKIDSTFCDRVTIAIPRGIHFPIANHLSKVAGIAVGRALRDAWEQTGKD